MKVTSEFLSRFHLDSRHSLLTTRDILIMKLFFDQLDVRGDGELDDIQFLGFMLSSTDLTERQTYAVFDVFDVDASGSIEFDEFYLLVCMLIAIKDKEEKQFLYHHWRTCFELLDVDGSGNISVPEFESFGFIFNFSRKITMAVFQDFDVDGNMTLDHDEFRMFTLACIDKQKELDEKEEQKKAKRRRKLVRRKRAIADATVPLNDGDGTAEDGGKVGEQGNEEAMAAAARAHAASPTRGLVMTLVMGLCSKCPSCVIL